MQNRIMQVMQAQATQATQSLPLLPYIKNEDVEYLLKNYTQLTEHTQEYMAASSPYVLNKVFTNTAITLKKVFFEKCENIFTLKEALGKFNIEMSLDDIVCLNVWICRLIEVQLNDVLKSLFSDRNQVYIHSLDCDLFLKTCVDLENYDAYSLLYKILTTQRYDVNDEELFTQALSHSYSTYPPNEYLLVLLENVRSKTNPLEEKWIEWFKYCLESKYLCAFVPKFLERMPNVNNKDVKTMCETVTYGNKLAVLKTLVDKKLVNVLQQDLPLYINSETLTCDEIESVIPSGELTLELFIVLNKNQHYDVIYNHFPKNNPITLGFMLYVAYIEKNQKLYTQVLKCSNKSKILQNAKEFLNI